MSQNAEVLKYLKQGKKLTASKAARELGIWRLAARINDLRAEGYNIVTTILKGSGGARFAQYHLGKKA